MKHHNIINGITGNFYTIAFSEIVTRYFHPNTLVKNLSEESEVLTYLNYNNISIQKRIFIAPHYEHQKAGRV